MPMAVDDIAALSRAAIPDARLTLPTLLAMAIIMPPALSRRASPACRCVSIKGRLCCDMAGPDMLTGSHSGGSTAVTRL